MNRLLLFNCSNDLALAADTPVYIPPKSVMRMEHDLCALPAWWAHDGDAILCPDSRHAEEAAEFFATHGMGITFTSPDEGYNALCARTGREYIAAPWGWSKAAVERFARAGMPREQLPDSHAIETMRTLSSREFAAGYIKNFLSTAALQGITGLVGDRMRFIRSMEELQIDERTIFKSPWSSSGRGIFAAGSLQAPSITEKLNGFIKHQGGFIADKLYDKKLDFALEFHIGDDGTARFTGCSVFAAGFNGYYGYNVTASQEQLRDIITSNGCPHSTLDTLTALHTALLQKELAGRYRGTVGIDMLIAEEGNKNPVVHPCIEINLRMNIGVLAMHVFERCGTRDTRLTPPHRGGTLAAYTQGGKLFIGVAPDACK